ncbi:hypothetical protein ACWGH8_05915 [Nonomuraea muscovyensis]|uniref:hypothetical protein n=1 Tax=Nonomuraea muscovyensis TaxID=1124761 RepID=UPI00340D12FC
MTAVAVAILLLVTTANDQGPEKVTSAASKECAPWKMSVYMNKQPAPGEREAAFICANRQRLVFNGHYAHVPDAKLLKIGRRLCQVSLRDDSREMHTVMETWGFVVNTEENTKALGYLCPALNRRQWAKDEALRQQEHDVITTAERRCASAPEHRPRTRPVLRDREMLWVAELGMLVIWEEGSQDDVHPSSLAKASANKVVGATPGDLTILTADTDKHVCVAVEAYARRPPVEVEGWEKVVEVGYRSTAGEMVFTGEDEEGNMIEVDELPDLAIRGAGRYRVRVHMRGAKAALADDGDARQQFLVVVYPGDSRRTKIYR